MPELETRFAQIPDWLNYNQPAVPSFLQTREDNRRQAESGRAERALQMREELQPYAVEEAKTQNALAKDALDYTVKTRAAEAQLGSAMNEISQLPGGYTNPRAFRMGMDILGQYPALANSKAGQLFLNNLGTANRINQELQKGMRIRELDAVLDTATKGGRFAGKLDPMTGEFQGADYEVLSESGADVAAIEAAKAERLASLRYDPSRSDTALQKNLDLYNRLVQAGDTEAAAIVMDAIRGPSLSRKAATEGKVFKAQLDSIRDKREQLAKDYSEDMTEERRKSERLRLDALEAELIRRFSEGESLDIREAMKSVPGRPAPVPGTAAPSPSGEIIMEWKPKIKAAVPPR